MTLIAILSVGEFVVNRDVPRCQHLPSSAGRGLELAAPAPTQCEIVSKTPQQRCPQNTLARHPELQSPENAFRQGVEML